MYFNLNQRGTIYLIQKKRNNLLPKYSGKTLLEQKRNTLQYTENVNVTNDVKDGTVSINYLLYSDNTLEEKSEIMKRNF